MVLTATQYFGKAAPATAVRPIPVVEPVRVRTRPDPALHENRTVLEHTVETMMSQGPLNADETPKARAVLERLVSIET